ncbi:MAG: hypothetical protein R2749_17480 [Acidimicrobiales bacterium]
MPISSDVGANAYWEVDTGVGRVRRPVSRHAEQTVSLEPARAWGAVLLDENEPRAATHREGVGDQQILFFEPETGRLLRRGAATAKPVLVMRHEQASFSCEGPSGESAPRVVEHLPPLHGAWSGFVVDWLDLTGVRALTVRRGPSVSAVRLVPPLAQPRVVIEPVAGLTTTSGLPVFGEPLTVELPAAPVPWQISLSIDGGAPQPVPETSGSNDEVRSLSLAQWLPMRPCIAQLVVRGALGSSLRLHAAVAPGLDARRPTQILFPGDRVVPISVAADGVDRVSATPGPADLAVQLALGSVPISVHVPKLAWGLAGPAQAAAALRPEPARVGIASVLNGDFTTLVVNLGESGHALRLELESDGRQIHVPRAGDRWVFDLQSLRSSIEELEARSKLILWVGQRPQAVVELVPDAAATIESLTASAVDGRVAVDLRYTARRRVRDRVLRLWPEHRPWAPAVTSQLPDDSDGHGTLWFNEADLPVGPYLAEIAVDDGWTRPSRPNAAEAVQVAVGSLSAMHARLNALPVENPFNAIERCLGEIGATEPLDDRSLDLAGGALVRSILDGPGGTRNAGLLWLATKARNALPRLLTDLAEDIDRPLSGEDLLKLAIVLVGRLHERAVQRTPDIVSLWSKAPALALALELAARRSPTGDLPSAEDEAAVRDALGIDLNGAPIDIPPTPQPTRNGWAGPQMPCAA